MTDWIEWSGGECPVLPDALVEIRRRDGSETATNEPTRHRWAYLYTTSGHDIVAYRVVSEGPKDETGVWIKWSGGERPVDGSTMVDVEFAGGGENVGWADQFSQDQWRGRGNYDDIIAYRVVPQNPVPDMVNSPPHYTDGGIETIDYIEAKLGPDGFKAYCVGNALKYISRAGKKGSAKEDLSKAIWYLRRAGGD